MTDTTACQPAPNRSEEGGDGHLLQDRVVILTGAGRGLGLITARRLLSQGARLIANHRSPSAELEELRTLHPDRLTLVQGDIAEEETAVRLSDAARAIGRLDVLIHNAAITRDGLLVRMKVEDWDDVMGVNARGAFLATKHSLKLMMRRRYGRVIYVSSIAAETGNAGQANYAASKAALNGLSRTVAQEYGGYGIRAVVLAPGFINTGLTGTVTEEVARTKIGRSLLGVGDVEKMASTIAFLAGPHADYINATVLRSDGGVAY